MAERCIVKPIRHRLAADRRTSARLNSEIHQSDATRQNYDHDANETGQRTSGATVRRHDLRQRREKKCNVCTRVKIDMRPERF